MSRSLQFAVILTGVLLFMGLTASFGQTADPNKEANSIVKSPSATYPRVPGIPIATGAAQPAISGPTLVFPANAKNSRAALTTRSGAAKSKSSAPNSGASNTGSNGDSDDNRGRQGKIPGAVSVPVFTGVFGQG